jgi:hypothetical protein
MLNNPWCIIKPSVSSHKHGETVLHFWLRAPPQPESRTSMAQRFCKLCSIGLSRTTAHHLGRISGERRLQPSGEASVLFILHPSAFILSRSTAPQICIHGIFVHSTRGNQGRVVSLARNRKVANKNGDTRNLMADEEFGHEPQTREKWRHAQV